MTEQKPELKDKMKTVLLRVWQTLVASVTQAGRFIAATAHKAGQNFAMGWHKSRQATIRLTRQSGNKIQTGLKAFTAFFARMIRQARYDINQLWQKTKKRSSRGQREKPNSAKADLKSAEKLRDEEDLIDLDDDENDHLDDKPFSESVRKISPAMKAKLRKIRAANPVSFLKSMKQADTDTRPDADKIAVADTKPVDSADVERKADHERSEKTADNQQTARYQIVNASDADQAQQQTTRHPSRSDLIKAAAADNKQLVAAPKKKKKTPPIKRRTRQRVYRLNGYTTVAKVNRKHRAEMQQQFLRKFLLYIGVILLVIILVRVYNPFTDLSEWYRIIGISDLSDLTQDNPLFPDVAPTPAD